MDGGGFGVSRGQGVRAAGLTPFFGRESETAELRDMVLRERLVTLVGPPGCGKTRLSIEVAETVGGEFSDGVRFVELASITEARLVDEVTARALGIADDPPRPLAETLTESLAEAELLLVLDNCEHLVDAAAGLVQRLVVACPAMRIVVTSRIPLGLPGEHAWQVHPLDLDAAVELFCHRARRAAANFTLGTAGRTLVEDICVRLDCLPLAVELAAAWAHVLSPAQILERLDEALPLLRTRGRASSPRHETMEATLDWSRRLLSSAARRLFDELSVFVGGFDLEAAEAVAGPGRGVLAGLASLVEHSLLTVQPAVDEPMRYRMLEPVRQYGAASLAERGDGDEVRWRHAEHYSDLARQCETDLRGHRRARALRRLEREDSNLLQAMQWARRDRSGRGLRLCVPLASVWEVRGRVNDGRACLEELLDVYSADTDLRATALARAARLAWRQRDYEQARLWLEESLDIERSTGEDLRVARRLRVLALVNLSHDDPEAAVRHGEESMEIFRAHADDQGLARVLAVLGWAHYFAGDVDRGDQRAQEALAVSRRAGSPADEAYSLLLLCFGTGRGVRHGRFVASGNAAAAPGRRYLVDGVNALRRAGGLVEDPHWLWAGGVLAAFEGRPRAALRLAGKAAALGRQGGSYAAATVMRASADVLDRARAEVGPAVAERLAAEGARMTIEELMTEALALPGDRDLLLSRREAEVADLVAEGLTNREVAGKLFISPRTVESHVDHIKQKLGLTSRQQIMAWALRDRLGQRNP
jgi:predicted ATPase/DNA-binding CsgD family transcriptional regulator